MTKAELIEIFRKANEDLTQANVRNIFKAKYGVSTLAVGNNTISIPVLTVDESYTSPNEYDISFIEAKDADGFDIRPALVISNKTAVSFDVYSPYITTLRWQIYLRVPNFNFFT